MEYRQGDKLELTEPIGEEGSKGFVKKGTKVSFDKLIDNQNDPSKALVIVKYQDRKLIVPEVDVRISSWFKRKKIEWEFNSKMMKGNPRLRRYHPIKIISYYFRFYYWFIDRKKK